MPNISKYNQADFTRTEQEIADLQKQVAANAALTAASQGTTPPTSQLGPCTGAGINGSNGFMIAERPDKKGVFETFCIQPMPSSTARIDVEIQNTADKAIKSATDFYHAYPDDTAISAGHFEFESKHPIAVGTQIGAIRIFATDANGNIIAKYPPTNPWNKTTGMYSYFDMWTSGNSPLAPAPPTCATDIKENDVIADVDGASAALVFRVWADPTFTKTFDQQQAVRATVYLQRLVGGIGGTVQPQFEKYSAVIQSGSAQFIDIAVSLPLGQAYQWTQNSLEHGTGRTLSATANPVCQFIAGGINEDQTALNAMANGTTITFGNTDSKWTTSTAAFTQPNPIFAIKKLQWLVSLDGGVTFSSDGSDRLLADQQYVTVGAHTAQLNVKSKVAINGKWKVRFFTKGGLQADSPVFTINGIADPTGDPAAPSAILNFKATWEAKSVVLSWTIPASNNKSIQHYEIYAVDSTNTFFMQMLSDGTTAAGQKSIANTQAATQIQKGKTHINLTLKLKNIDPVYNGVAPANVIRFHVRAVNLVSNILTEGADASFDVVPGNDYLGSGDQVIAVDPGITMNPQQPITDNGGFGYASGDPNTLASWLAATIGNPGLRSTVTTNPPGPVWENFTQHRVRVVQGWMLCQQIGKKFDAGQFFSFFFTVNSAGTPLVTFNVRIRDNNGLDNTDTIFTIPNITVTLGTGVPMIFSGTLKIKNNPTGIGTKQFICAEFTSASDSSSVWMYTFRGDRGKTPFAWAPSSKRETSPLNPNSEDFDTPVLSTAQPQPDLGNPIVWAPGAPTQNFNPHGGIMRIETFQ